MSFSSIFLEYLEEKIDQSEFYKPQLCEMCAKYETVWTFLSSIPKASSHCSKQVQPQSLCSSQHQTALQKTVSMQVVSSTFPWQTHQAGRRTFSLQGHLLGSLLISVQGESVFTVYIASTFSFHCHYLSHTLCVFQWRAKEAAADKGKGQALKISPEPWNKGYYKELSVFLPA